MEQTVAVGAMLPWRCACVWVFHDSHKAGGGASHLSPLLMQCVTSALHIVRVSVACER